MDKAPDAFRTISEVADELDIPQHVLRFWESRFSQIKPMKRAGGRRYYRPDDVDLLRGIRHLLYGEGYTIRGVQRILKEQGPRFVQAAWQQPAAEAIAAGRSGLPGGPASSASLLPASAEAGDEDADADNWTAGDWDAGEQGGHGQDIHEHDTGADDADAGMAGAAYPAEPKRRFEEPPPAVAAPVFALSADDAGRLRHAIDELAECRRLLDEAMRADAMMDDNPSEVAGEARTG